MIQQKILTLTILLLIVAPCAHAQKSDIDAMRAWIQEMKEADRGPFRRIRWFCQDGEILPPEPYACRPHGGGVQHGEWSKNTRKIRTAGYLIANLLASVDKRILTDKPERADLFKQILLEQFLISVDNGWIMRKAQFYRGAIQGEDERRVARDVLRTLARNPAWARQGYLPLRTGARLLAHGADTGSVSEVRQLSTGLAERDSGFQKLRNKIHGAPDKDDARRVREYAANVASEALKKDYELLAESIDKVYNASLLSEIIARLAKRQARQPKLAELLNAGVFALESVEDPQERLTETARLLIALRYFLPQIRGTKTALDVVDLGLALELEHFVAATALRERLPQATRSERIEWLAASAGAIFGAGLISARELKELRDTFGRLQGTDIALQVYKSELDYLARVPGWGSQRMRQHFGATMDKFAEIEPLANLYIQDQLRSSPLLFFSVVLDSLLRDANRLAGVRHEIFGEEVGAGLRSLNPGLARGTLQLDPGEETASFDRDGIYLLPETIAELPPVAGILTAGEGNPLSHVQLLARNLGIPNVGVDQGVIPKLESHAGQPVFLAVSPAGSVQVVSYSDEFEDLFREQDSSVAMLISPDLDKLDLDQQDFVPLSQLRADDSGRTVGPKAAKLGELYHHYPEAVADGLAIPFGAFRRLLDQPRQDGQTIFEWMVSQYAMLREMPDASEEREQATQAFRAQLQDTILQTNSGGEFRRKLRAAMEAVFGANGTYGVFVRSDTNVEDLPGFTGAGLNLTVPHVVGYEKLFEAISRVWASPFSERAFAWRQGQMDKPEHVYPAVLIMRSVPVEKSGVMVTRDIDSGDPDWISLAVNEGVGGAVDGQAAESLRVSITSGEMRVLASATAPLRRILKRKGGIARVPVSGEPAVLSKDEIARLIALARELPERFPPIVDAQGKPAPADIEFGFLEGKLKLFQIRPFLESADARGSDFLNSLDENLQLEATVDMRGVPQA
ncbi:MAG: PEP/pyruvate-binding domain-containing protein [Gammaproteobacteria bacterium]